MPYEIDAKAQQPVFVRYHQPGNFSEEKFRQKRSSPRLFAVEASADVADYFVASGIA